MVVTFSVAAIALVSSALAKVPTAQDAPQAETADSRFVIPDAIVLPKRTRAGRPVPARVASATTALPVGASAAHAPKALAVQAAAVAPVTPVAPAPPAPAPAPPAPAPIAKSAPPRAPSLEARATSAEMQEAATLLARARGESSL